MRVFGIGCIYFGYDAQQIEPDYLKPPQYLTDLKIRLEKIENISNVEISGAETPYSSIASIEDGDQEIVVPMPQGAARCGFDLYLPFRVQEIVFEKCDVESIRVDVIFPYELLVAIISYEWPDEEGDASPSMAVAIVRKYLRDKMCDQIFKCGSIGPSPFHADFVVRESKFEDRFGIDDVSENRLGYASIELVCPIDHDLVESITRSNLDSIFSKYYRLSNLRIRGIKSQGVIYATTRELLENKGPPNFFKRWNHLRKQEDAIDALNSEVFTESLIRLEMENALADAERSDIAGAGNPLDRFFLEYRSFASQDNWSKFSDIGKFFEERRQKYIGNVASIFSGVIGGLVGAIIGSLITYVLTQPPQNIIQLPPQPPAPATVPDTAR